MTSSPPIAVPVAEAAEVVKVDAVIVTALDVVVGVAVDIVIVTALEVVVGSTIDTVEPVGPNICLLFIIFISEFEPHRSHAVEV